MPRARVKCGSRAIDNDTFQKVAGDGRMAATYGRQVRSEDLLVFSKGRGMRPVYTTRLGALFKGDCLNILPTIPAESIDAVFADPPFNLGKDYGRKVNDRRTDEDYVKWCRKWI